jgi:glycosyltransferase involved in cell wall biosynthesis
VSDFTVVICTRDRARQVLSALAGLDAQSWRDFDILVVDQSDAVNDELLRRDREDPRFTAIRDAGRGLSRARNVAWPAVRTEWVVYLDDDCVPEPDWAFELHEVLTRQSSDVGFVSGHVSAGDPPAGDYLVVTEFPVHCEQVRSGRWTRPWQIGVGVCMAIRRSVIAGLGGWDVRLGAGTAPFPAAEDMDFNYRFLKVGGIAFATPRVRARHQQWRSREDLRPLYRGYMAAWCAFAMKHLRTGDVAGGLWLWSLGATDAARMLASAVRRRSSLRLYVGAAKVRGLMEGTARGLTYRW